MEGVTSVVTPSGNQDIKTQLFIGLYGLKDGGDFHHEEIQWFGLADPCS
jgi:hypothetical protein